MDPRASQHAATDRPLERLLPLREVSELLGVPEETLRYWRARGEGPDSFVIGRRRIVYRESVIRAYVDACEAQSRR